MKILIAAILLVCLLVASDARLPAAGDYVQINTENLFYWGNITNVTDNFYCLHADGFAKRVDTSSYYEEANTTRPFDICLAIDTIKNIRWGILS